MSTHSVCALCLKRMPLTFTVYGCITPLTFSIALGLYAEVLPYVARERITEGAVPCDSGRTLYSERIPTPTITVRASHTRW